MKHAAAITAWCWIMAGLLAPCSAPAAEGNAGLYEADVLPQDAEPAWPLISGKADEAIEDGKWVVRQPANFCRGLDFGQPDLREGQENVVEICWSTTSRDNHAADGLCIHTQGKRFRLHPINNPDGEDLLLVGARPAMLPDVPQAIVDLSALPDFDAAKLNTYSIRWVTDEDNSYDFELSINGKPVARLPGELIPGPAKSSLALEFRGGEHAIDWIHWTLNRGGKLIVQKASRTVQTLIDRGCRQLFLDDVMIERIDGLRRVVNQPAKYEKNPIIRHDQTPWQTYRTQLYGTSIYDPDDELFKIWYLAGVRLPYKEGVKIGGRMRCPNFQCVGYAVSKDGLNFELPNLGVLELDGSTDNNLCRIARECAEGIAVLRDPGDADPQQRFKAFYWDHYVPYKDAPGVPVNGMSVSFSADGKSWTDYEKNPVMALGSDTGQQVVWDPAIRRYVAYGRFGAGGRRVARSDSKDFIKWSAPQLVFQADEADGPGTQIYGMSVRMYEGIYLGMPWIFREGTTHRIDAQLTTSRDGIHWHRVGDRQTFIPNGPPGSWDAGIIFTANQSPAVLGDKMFVYYSGSRHDHNYRNRAPEGSPEWLAEWDAIKTSIGVATLRRDGFVSLDASDTPGTLLTKPFFWPKGATLHLNVDATGGEVQVAVLDEQGKPIASLQKSTAVTGDHVDTPITWPASAAEPPADRPVSLKLTLRRTKLYSYWFARPEVPPWTFVSIPDFTNNDVAYPEPRWDDALDYVLREIKAENPDFVLVAGDLVMGRWSHSREHLEKMAEIYYPGWIDRMKAHGLKYYVALGDHEIGDLPWPEKNSHLIPVYKDAFRKYLKMPTDGPDGYRGATYAVEHKNLLLLTVDQFEQDTDGKVHARVSAGQLDWLRDTLAKHRGAVHRVFMGHVPILPKWRWRSSSRLHVPGGSNTPFWRLMRSAHADLYLCGEVHDVSIQEEGGVLQVVHGSQPSNVSEFNYLVVTVHPGRLELKLKAIETVLEGPSGKNLDPYGVDPYTKGTVRIAEDKKKQGFVTTGTMVIDKTSGGKSFAKRTGFFETCYHDD